MSRRRPRPAVAAPGGAPVVLAHLAAFAGLVLPLIGNVVGPLLVRHSWPGNTEQLWQVLKQVVQRRRAGVIMPKDLPPECWTVSRRLLSPLESIERDAIVQSLQDHDGNKVRAAEALGMSRATIYRKIHEYGIVASSS